MRVAAFVSRVTHQTSVSILTGGSLLMALSPEVAEAMSGKGAKLFIVAAVLSAISGLYNVHALGVKQKLPAAQLSTYRYLVYGVKGMLWLSLSPLVKFVPGVQADNERFVRAGGAMGLMLVASYLKYFREENTVTDGTPKPKSG